MIVEKLLKLVCYYIKRETHYGTANQTFATSVKRYTEDTSHLVSLKLQHRVMHGYEYIRKLNRKFRKRSIGELWQYDRLVYVTSV